MRLRKDLQPGEKLLDDAFLSETLSSGRFECRTVTSSFDFRVHVSVRALVSRMRMFAWLLQRSWVMGRILKIFVWSTRCLIRLFHKTLGVKVRVSVEKGQNMDIEQISSEFLGRSVGDVQARYLPIIRIFKN